MRERVDAQLARFRSGEANDLLLSVKNGTPPDWSSIRSLVPAMSGFEALRETVSAAPGYEDVLLGCATPMEKVLPRVPVFRPLPETIAIEAARNEKEAAQLIVMPLGKERKKVGVRLTAFTGPAGTLPGSALSAVPVGFVETTFVPRSGSEYVGFWPDPLLAFLDTVDVGADEAQPFWIKADIPAGQPAGVYSGKAEITIGGKTAFSVPVSVRVRDFALPNRPMLPLAVTFWPNDGLMPKCNPEFDPEARKSLAAPVHAWKKHKKAWRDMLAGYGLMIDSLYEYGDWAPEFELLAELDREGKLGMFSLGYYHPASENPADNYGMQSTIDRIRPRYEKAKRLGILKHAYIYGCDSIMLDLEDAVAENQKDAARFSLYHALTTIDYGKTEVIVRINGLDTPHWQEDIRVCVAGGADGIRIAKCESAQDVHTVEAAVEAAEKEFGVEVGRTLLMAALESPKGILNAYEICSASDRMFGVAISGGDFRKCMQTKFSPDGVDMLAARGQMLLAARAAGIQCFDTVFTDLDDEEGFRAEVLQNKAMGFDGKSLINPKQIRPVHEIFAPTEKEVAQAEAWVSAFREAQARGVGVFTVNGKMVDAAFIPGAERTLRLAKACGMYEGDLV